MALSTQPYKGTRDFYPEDMRLQKYIYATWRKAAEMYGYEEYDAPLIEATDLYRAKTGEEIVNEQTYTFEDRGGRDVTIRPEMTPTVSRMIAGKRQETPYPARWYSIPNLWRYERPQKGRLREHWQLNVDLFGVETIDAELEIILVARQIMKSFKATDEMYTIKLNSRRLTARIMADFLELDASQSHNMTKLLDKKDKISKETFDSQAKQIFGDNHDSGLEKLHQLAAAKSMADLPAQLQDDESVHEIQLLFTHLKSNGVKNVVFDVSLMRGFDYYTDIVFEVYDNHPENNRSMFGGGRYDGLVGMFGVAPVPTVGFGMGDVTISDFLKAHNLVPELPSTTDVAVIVIGDYLRQAQGVASILRGGGLNVDVDISNRKTEKQIRSAAKKGITYALFVGENELSSELFTLKNLQTEEEEKLNLEQIVEKARSSSN